MQIGTALQAPEGYFSLVAKQTYYFLYSNRRTGKALLLLFANHKRWLAHLYVLPRTEFEKCLSDGSIVETHGTGHPPFFDRVHGLNLYNYDLERRNAQKLHSDRAQDRLLKIAPLLERQDQILDASDPEREISKYARANGLNPQRVRFWFFTYMCFGQDSSMLFPHYFNCGHWNRLENDGVEKFGRKSKTLGKRSGHRLNENDINLIVKSYIKLRKQGETLKSIYTDAACKFFNAIAIKNGNKLELVSSNERPLPSINQYRYQLIKALGLEEIQRWRWGESKYRRAHAAHKGTFASSASNLLERTEADAYYSESPRGMHREALPPLAVARLIDTASGMRLGIGFAFEKENSVAYNTALFCAAVPKRDFCRYFGIEIEEHEWPSQGLPLLYTTDRGPGIKPEPGHEQHPGEGIGIREFTPSGQGQSKSLVESSQRRNTKMEGPTQQKVSDLTP